jgi:hypothetical protein
VEHKYDWEKGADAGLQSELEDGQVRDGAVRRGFLADPLNLANETEIGLPSNHQIYFIGDEPYGLDGHSLLGILGGGANVTPIFDGHHSSYYFSHKLVAGGAMRDYTSIAEKFEQHYGVIAGPATYRYPEADKDFLDVDFGADLESPFCFPDTFSAHAELNGLNAKLKPLTVGIIGLGGTGSYVLDFLSKTPLKRIRLFDDDEYIIKNAFRSPGTTVHSDFKKSKVELYVERYSTFRMDVVGDKSRISRNNPSTVSDCDFVFVCVDKGSSRAEVVGLLRELGKPFIDVGMGLTRAVDGLNGGVRTTLVDEQTADRVLANSTLPMDDDEDDLYQTNIQIAELNALNAALAIILFKKRFGYYVDEDPNYNVLLALGRLKLFSQSV